MVFGLGNLNCAGKAESDSEPEDLPVKPERREEAHPEPNSDPGPGPGAKDTVKSRKKRWSFARLSFSKGKGERRKTSVPVSSIPAQEDQVEQQPTTSDNLEESPDDHDPNVNDANHVDVDFLGESLSRQQYVRKSQNFAHDIQAVKLRNTKPSTSTSRVETENNLETPPPKLVSRINKAYPPPPIPKQAGMEAAPRKTNTQAPPPPPPKKGMKPVPKPRNQSGITLEAANVQDGISNDSGTDSDARNPEAGASSSSPSVKPRPLPRQQNQKNPKIKEIIGEMEELEKELKEMK